MVMGNLGGHAVPGVLFMCYGLLWIVLSFWNYLSSHSKLTKTTGNKSSNKLTYAEFKRDIEASRKSYLPHYCCLGNCPLDPIMKVVLSFAGILVEAFLDYRDGSVVFRAYSVYNDEGSYAKLHHITMYFSFLLTGIVDLTMLFVRLPKHTSKCFLSLAFLVEGILFLYHGEGKGDLDCYVHHLLTLAILFSFVFSVLRLLETNNVFYNSGLGASIALQGTWFIQIGTMLYGHTHWENDDPSNKRFAIACFTWHIIAIATVTLVLYVILMACLRSSIKYRGNKSSRRSTATNVLPFTQPLSRVTMEEREKLIAEKEMNDMAGHNSAVFADTLT